MRLNVVCDDAILVHQALIDAFEDSSHGIKVYLANRPAKGIVEFDFVADDICCISLEGIQEALYFIPDCCIRFVIGK